MPLSSTGTMASKRVGSKDIVESATGDVIEQVSMSLPIYEDTKLFIDKDIRMKWHNIKDTFLGTFEENMEDHRVYANIHKSDLYQISCRYPMFPSTDMTHWIGSHTDLETMVLSNVSGTKFSTFRVKEF